MERDYTQAPPPAPKPEPPIEGQTSLLELVCTCSEDCQAPADKHEAECPVEQELLRIYKGF